MTHSDKAPTAEQLAMARRIAQAVVPYPPKGTRPRQNLQQQRAAAKQAALLAISQTSEATASWIEGRALPSTVTQRLAELYRGGDHLKGQPHD